MTGWHIGLMWGSEVIMNPVRYPDFAPDDDDVDGELFTERLKAMQAEVTEKYKEVFPFYRFHLQKKMRMHMIAEAHFGVIVADSLATTHAEKYGRNPLPGAGAYGLASFFQAALENTAKPEEVYELFRRASDISRKYDLYLLDPQPLIYHHLDLNE